MGHHHSPASSKCSRDSQDGSVDSWHASQALQVSEYHGVIIFGKLVLAKNEVCRCVFVGLTELLSQRKLFHIPVKRFQSLKVSIWHTFIANTTLACIRLCRYKGHRLSGIVTLHSSRCLQCGLWPIVLWCSAAMPMSFCKWRTENTFENENLQTTPVLILLTLSGSVLHLCLNRISGQLFQTEDRQQVVKLAEAQNCVCNLSPEQNHSYQASQRFSFAPHTSFLHSIYPDRRFFFLKDPCSSSFMIRPTSESKGWPGPYLGTEPPHHPYKPSPILPESNFPLLKLALENSAKVTNDLSASHKRVSPSPGKSTRTHFSQAHRLRVTFGVWT